MSVQSQVRAGRSQPRPACSPSKQFQRVPHRWAPWSARERGACACPCVLGTLPFPGAGAELPPSASAGDPLPQHREPRVPCPLCQGEKAAEPETKKLLPPPLSAPPPASDSPPHPPSTLATSRAWTLRGSGGGWQGGRVCSLMRASWRLPVLPARGHPMAAAPPPTAHQTVPAPRHRHHRPRPYSYLSSGAIGGRTEHKAGGEGGEYRGGRDPARAWHGPRRSYLPDFFFDL